MTETTRRQQLQGLRPRARPRGQQRKRPQQPQQQLERLWRGRDTADGTGEGTGVVLAAPRAVAKTAVHVVGTIDQGEVAKKLGTNVTPRTSVCGIRDNHGDQPLPGGLLRPYPY
eukprot:g10884.t1